MDFGTLIAILVLSLLNVVVGLRNGRKAAKLDPEATALIAQQLMDYIDDAIKRQDDRIQKRLERQAPTNHDAPDISNFKSGQYVPGQYGI